MFIGIPKEIKIKEYRVGAVPASVREFVKQGHQVIVETDAGLGIGATDKDYEAAGASIATSAKAIFDQANMIIKVKEPQAVERKMLRSDQILFTYLHLAPDPEQAADLIKSGATCIAYEGVTAAEGGFPLLAPMSEVAGRLSVLVGAYFLGKTHGGSGVLLGGVPGVLPAKVAIIGGGVVGAHAATMALGLGAQVTIVDRNVNTLRNLWKQFGNHLLTAYSTHDTIERLCMEVDLVIGGVLVPGATAPKLITRSIVEKMRPGSVIVDVAIDQGGCCETSRATTHENPVYDVGGVIHYCVANMPGSVPRTSAYALNNATLPFQLALANKGLTALQDDQHLLNGLSVHHGLITSQPVAEALGYQFVPPKEALRQYPKR